MASEQQQIRLSKPSIGNEEVQAAARALKAEFLGMGPEAKAFEEELTTYFNNDMHVVCVNSGTAAIQLALQSCNIGLGDEVIVPALTYVATLQAISALGATPVICDTSLESGTIDITDFANKITSKTKAVVPVHFAGRLPEYSEIYEIAQKHHLHVVEDAAHAFGSWRDGKRLFSENGLICYSLGPIKNITAIQGGIITTCSTSVLKKLRHLRVLGIDKENIQTEEPLLPWDFEVYEQGWRYHLNDVMAAVGRAQLKKADQFYAQRKLLAKRYDHLLQDCKNIRFLGHDYDEIFPHIYCLRITNGKRNELFHALRAAKIDCFVHYKPNHLLHKYKGGSLPNSEKLYAELITLPLHTDLTETDQLRIVEVIKSVVGK